MNSSTKNILIGLFALVAAALIIFMLLFLHPTVGDEGKTFRVRFTNIDKVNIGTRVTYAGHPVGEVVSIRELPDARQDLVAPSGQVYVYELVLDVDSSVDVFNTDIISVQTSGLLGERNVEITPRAPSKDEKLYIIENNILYAVPAGSVEETLNKVSDMTKKLSTLIDEAQEVVHSITEEKLVHSISEAARNIADITKSLDQPEKWGHTLDQFSSLVDRAHHSWNQVDLTLNNLASLSQRAQSSWSQVDCTLGEFQIASSQFKEAALSSNQIIQRIHEGEGTIGQLLAKDELYLKFKSLLYKGETIFDDIKRYGILFQHDKRWQRLQARRLHLVEQLSSPGAFAYYFDEELEKLHLSVANVSSALEEFETCPESVLSHPAFRQRFSQLLKEASELEDTLNLYHTVIDCKE